MQTYGHMYPLYVEKYQVPILCRKAMHAYKQIHIHKRKNTTHNTLIFPTNLFLQKTHTSELTYSKKNLGEVTCSSLFLLFIFSNCGMNYFLPISYLEKYFKMFCFYGLIL